MFLALGKGLAAHLAVPLPYLVYRAQVGYEEGLRGLQGITALSPTVTSPINQGLGPTTSSSPPPKPTGTSGEYFPKMTTPDRLFPRRDSLRFGSGNLSTSIVGRPLAIRTRLNSIGNRSIKSPQKVSSSSVITLQGPKRTHTQLRPLSPTSSCASPSSPASTADASSEGEEDEETRKEEEEERRIEEQEALEKKLKDLHRMMTKEAVGLISSPPQPTSLRYQEKGKGRERDGGRLRPLSTSSTSSSLHQRLDMSRPYGQSKTPSHHSLSSASSPQGSIPSIPSPPPEPRSPQLSPIARHLSPVGKSTSPPAVSHGSVWGTVRHTPRTRIAGKGRSDRGSEIGSEASSFSDLSGGKCRISLCHYNLADCLKDASLSTSALESALLSNIRGGGSRM